MFSSPHFFCTECSFSREIQQLLIVAVLKYVIGGATSIIAGLGHQDIKAETVLLCWELILKDRGWKL